MKENLHEGHRKRVREEFLSRGFDGSTPPHKVLELLLFYCVQREDTNPLAHELIDKYKTIAGVLDAPVEELIKFKGLTRRSATLLKLIMPIARIYTSDKLQDRPTFNSLDDIGNFLVSKFVGLREEKVGLVCLNTKSQLLRFDFLAEGDMSSVGISIRSIVKAAIESEATTVVLAHNHPSGFAIPSENDTFVTRAAVEALARIGIKMIDHIVVDDNDFVSMAQSYEFADIFNI